MSASTDLCMPSILKSQVLTLEEREAVGNWMSVNKWRNSRLAKTSHFALLTGGRSRAAGRQEDFQNGIVDPFCPWQLPMQSYHGSGKIPIILIFNPTRKGGGRKRGREKQPMGKTFSRDKGESKLQRYCYEWQQGPAGHDGARSQPSLFLNTKQSLYWTGKRTECSSIILKSGLTY